MNNPRILVVIGTRPEAIKMAPVIRALKQCSSLDVRVCVSAQHREMLDQVLRFFAVEPEYDLDVMRSATGLTGVAAEVMLGLQQVFDDWHPERVVVHGDTTTTFAAALAATYNRIPIAHVEAGLRTGDPRYPWPEEINRTLTTITADIHFAPTPAARDNLLREGVQAAQILVTGNTVIDALLATYGKLLADQSLVARLAQEFAYLGQKRLILVTGHRRESFGRGLRNVCEALLDLAKRDDVSILFPVHLNPNVLGPVHEHLGSAPNVFLVPPLDYLPFVYLMHRAYFIITDSGGIQEEAPTFAKPVLVTRTTTERAEAVAAGSAILVGPDRKHIVQQSVKLLDDAHWYARTSQAHNPFGDGCAAERIASYLQAHCGDGRFPAPWDGNETAH